MWPLQGGIKETALVTWVALEISQLLPRRGFDTFYGSYLGVLDHFTHVRDKYEGYDFHKDEKVLFNASGRYTLQI